MDATSPPWWKHLRDLLILPFSATVLIPLAVHGGAAAWWPAHWSWQVLGTAALLAGLLLFVSTVRLFVQRGRGTLAPWTPTQRLIITGPYRYVRNPMISGVLFILIGEALWLRSVSIGLWALLFFAINTVYFIMREEPSMLARFGEEYRDHKARVPRWLPKWW